MAEWDEHPFRPAEALPQQILVARRHDRVELGADQQHALRLDVGAESQRIGNQLPRDFARQLRGAHAVVAQPPRAPLDDAPFVRTQQQVRQVAAGEAQGGDRQRWIDGREDGREQPPGRDPDRGSGPRIDLRLLPRPREQDAVLHDRAPEQLFQFVAALSGGQRAPRPCRPADRVPLRRELARDDPHQILTAAEDRQRQHERDRPISLR